MQIHRLFFTVITASLLACDRGQPTAEPASDECQVMLVIETSGDPQVTLQARAKNLTNQALELALEDHCPGGEAQFSGLGESFDYYHTCGMGACAGGRPPVVIALPPGEIVDISTTEIRLDGEQSCNQPLASGAYELSFSLGLAKGASNPRTCGPEPLVIRRE